jgi:cellulose 1,4-beta-cellobiosidase
MITNMGVPKCANAATAYEDLTVYALKTLNFANVDMYLDGGHAGWLGWEANIGPAAKLYARVYKSAGSPRAVRGIVTNVSNYNAFSIGTCNSITQGNKNCDEQRFIDSFAPMLRAEGFPAHFIVDVGRSGKQPTGQQAWGDWCNVSGAGFGPRPTTNTGNANVDALVWVKPGGEVSLALAPVLFDIVQMLTKCSSPMVLPTRLPFATTASAARLLLSSPRLRLVPGSRLTLRCCSRTPTLLSLRWGL